MFVNPNDTIAATDTIPFFLKKEAVMPIAEHESQAVGYVKHKAGEGDETVFFAEEVPATFVSTASGADPGLRGESLARSQFFESIFFILFSFCFVLFAIVFRKERQSLIGNFKNLLNFGNRNKYVFKEQITTSEMWGEMFLLMQAILGTSMVVFAWQWDPVIVAMTLKSQILLFLSILLLLAVYLVFKYGVYRIIGFALPELEMDEWSEKFLWVVELFGVLIFLPALLYIYLPEYRSILFISLLIIFFTSFGLIFVSLLGIFVKNKIGFLYFIVYLCAVEIAPFLVLYKGSVLLINYAGVIL